MTIEIKKAAFLLSSTIAAGMYGSAAFAADVDMDMRLPAVSGPNGKVEIGVGFVDIDELGDDEAFRGGASLSFPVGDMFGIQGDLAVVDAFDETLFGGTLHFFTRDPDSYLFGAIAGYADVGGSDMFYIGPEIELYIDNISLEATAGYLDVDDSLLNNEEFFALADLAFYATDDLRFSIGASSVAGFSSGHLGMEWFLSDVGVPASFKLDGRLGDDGYTAITAGFAIYFGGEDKSLIRRHREDDPRNRSLDIFNAGAFGEEEEDAAPTPLCPEDGEVYDPVLERCVFIPD